MRAQFYKQITRVAHLLALAVLLAPASFAVVTLEYLVLMADGTPGVSYRVCGYNPTDVAQTAVLEIDYSDVMVPTEQVDLPVGPRTTACLDLEVSGVAVIKSTVRALDLRGGNGNDVLFVGNGACGLPPGLLPSVNMQLTVRYDGVPTIGLLLPAVQGVRESSRQ